MSVLCVICFDNGITNDTSILIERNRYIFYKVETIYEN